MGNNMYWISTLTYAGILAFILVNDGKTRKKVGKVEQSFRLMINWVIIFCLQDTFWGLCAADLVRSDTVFFISSEVFHVSTVITTFFWLYYVLIYLDVKQQTMNRIIILDALVIAFEFILVIVNIFRPTLFHIAGGVYNADSLRAVTFYNQYFVYLIIGAVAYISAAKTKDTNPYKSEKYKFVFIATLAPVILGITQLLFVDAPFYSLGYFLGCVLIHNLVLSKDVKEAEKADLYKAVENSLYSLHIFDLENHSVDRMMESDILKGIIKNITDPQEMITAVVHNTCCDEYLSVMDEFIDLSTISERLKGKKFITCEFVGKNYGWTRMSLVSILREDNVEKKIAVITQIIDSAKREQIDLIFKSNNDELTRLYNRRAYEAELESIEKNGNLDEIIIVVMDVNGLKTVNDTIGHGAGDDMLKAASECMKKTFSPYGKIYRIGGDEFTVILHSVNERLPFLLNNFANAVASYKTPEVSNLAISVGYASGAEEKGASLKELIILADKRMYEDKQSFYEKRLNDRRMKHRQM